MRSRSARDIDLDIEHQPRVADDLHRRVGLRQLLDHRGRCDAGGRRCMYGNAASSVALSPAAMSGIFWPGPMPISPRRLRTASIRSFSVVTFASAAASIRSGCDLRIRREADALAGATGERRDLLPQLLGDERDERMREAQHRFQHANQRAARAALHRLVARAQLDLGQLDVPVAVLVPDEPIDRSWRRCRGGSRRSPARLRPRRAAAGSRSSDRPPRASPASPLASRPQSLPSTFISTKRVAFQSLLQKLR